MSGLAICLLFFLSLALFILLCRSTSSVCVSLLGSWSALISVFNYTSAFVSLRDLFLFLNICSVSLSAFFRLISYFNSLHKIFLSFRIPARSLSISFFSPISYFYSLHMIFLSFRISALSFLSQFLCLIFYFFLNILCISAQLLSFYIFATLFLHLYLCHL